MINLSSSGITKSEPIFSLSLHACPSVDITLNDVEGVLIGQEGAEPAYFEEMACDITTDGIQILGETGI